MHDDRESVAQPLGHRERGGAGVERALRVVCVVALVLTAAPQRARAEPPTLQQQVDSAQELVAQQRFAEARVVFQRVLDQLPPGAQARVSLRYSIASCDYELRHFSAAEAGFLAVAEASAKLRDDARLHAGLSAVARGDLEAARRHLRAVSADTRQQQVYRELKKRIDAHGRAGRRAELVRAYRAALTALKRGQLKLARRQLRRVLDGAEGHFSAQEWARLYTALGRVARQQQRFDDSVRWLTKALQRSPTSGLYYERGLAHWQKGDLDSAEDDFRAARRVSADSANEARAGQALRRAYRLPARGWHIGLGLGGGWDSNAGQSGSGAVLGRSTTSAETASTFARVRAGVAHHWAPAARADLSLAYDWDATALLARAVREQSLQTHRQAAAVSYALSPWTRAGVEVGIIETLQGWSDWSAFSLEPLVRGELSHLESIHWETTISAEYRNILGLSGRDYLDGHWVSGRLAQRYLRPAWSTELWASASHYGVGAQTIEFPVSDLYHCAAPSNVQNMRCAAREFQEGFYTIALSYWTPEVGLGVNLRPAAAWSVDLGAGVAQRYYTEESFAFPDEDDGDELRSLSSKLRVDSRIETQAALRWLTWPDAGIGWTLEYTFLVSRSNMAREKPRSSPERREPDGNFDYDNRNFEQHIIELVVGWEH